MKKFVTLSSVLGLLLGFGARADAASILFDPDGTGSLTAVSVDLFDPTTGNALGLNINANVTVGTTGTILYQANLSIGSDNGTTTFASCLGGADCFTFVAAVDVIVSATGTNSFSLGLDPNGTLNVFNMYATSAPANNLTGAGFTSGTLIMSGSFTSFASQFTAGGTIDLLDQFGADNWGGAQTVTGGGIGSTSGGGTFNGTVSVNLASLDPNYFLSQLLSFTISATSQSVLPFGQVNPSFCFSATAAPGTDCTQVSDVLGVNGINGLNTNTITQTDANLSLLATSAVPEPATLTLLGLGLLGSAAARRRQMKKKAKK